jgi:hypothetical protein
MCFQSVVRCQLSVAERQRDEIRGQRREDRLFNDLNNEQQNKKPQHAEVITSKSEIPCSIFCAS